MTKEYNARVEQLSPSSLSEEDLKKEKDKIFHDLTTKYSDRIGKVFFCACKLSDLHDVIQVTCCSDLFFLGVLSSLTLWTHTWVRIGLPKFYR